MAPTRKSRSVNKRFSNSPDKDVGNSYKSRQRKRKLSDMLGSQWSKDELQCFYEAYRNYGKDWKKVAGVVRNRSVEMVEALYNMNRAYLSLPDGTASVAGLIAMMTDHYNVLEVSESDRESYDALRLFHNPQRRGQGKVQLSGSKDRLQSLSVASNDGCLSLLKRRRSDGCPVGKRTPRFPVSYSSRKDGGENYVSPNKGGRKSGVDDEVTHGAVLALTEALQRGSSPQHSKSEIARAKLPGTTTDEDYLEFSLGSRGCEKGDYARDIANDLMGNEGVGTVEAYRKGRKFCRKKEKVENVRINQCDDGREACSGTEGPDVRDVKGKVDFEVMNVKIDGSYSQGRRKRNKKLFFGDESSALDALQTLADLSLMMPASTIESESSVQLNEQKPNLDLADKSSVHEAMPISHQEDKTKILPVRERVLLESSGVEASTSGKCRLVRDTEVDVDATQSSNKGWSRKQRSCLFKAFAEVEEKVVVKGKRTGQISAPSKQWKMVRPAECSSISDQKGGGTDSAAATAQVPTTSQIILPTKQQSRRKIDPKRMLIQKEIKTGEIISKDWPDKYSTSLQDKLSCYLSTYMVRRWCTFEWFYSAIDYPWFAKREFVDYLNHVGLGHIPRLTRVEWGVIRSSLGKPRRFSEHFLGEEKAKLTQYRELVRKRYTELRAGIREGLPTDLARPLSVGQRVIALHPKSREIHDGSVLTVDHDKCRIQFDRPELGVEFVMDIDCMPVNPLENMPEVLRRQNIAVDRVSVNSREQKAGQLNSGGSMAFSPSEHLENICGPIHTSITQAKEAKLMELKLAKDDVLKTQNGGDNSLKDSELLKKQYMTVFSAPIALRQHNTYLGNSLPPWLRPPAISSGLGDPPSSMEHSSVNYQESGSNVVEIVKDSRLKAHTMVDAAFQAMSSMKEGEDAFMRIGEALDSKFSSDSGPSTMRSPKQVTGVAYQHQLSPFILEAPLIGHATGPKLHNESDRIEAQIPSELITSCLATFLMVQMCTERQYPPADVAQILDSAVTSLHPCCPQNLPIYRDIQMCMGKIKTQILALVPT